MAIAVLSLKLKCFDFKGWDIPLIYSRWWLYIECHPKPLPLTHPLPLPPPLETYPIPTHFRYVFNPHKFPYKAVLCSHNPYPCCSPNPLHQPRHFTESCYPCPSTRRLTQVHYAMYIKATSPPLGLLSTATSLCLDIQEQITIPF